MRTEPEYTRISVHVSVCNRLYLCKEVAGSNPSPPAPPPLACHCAPTVTSLAPAIYFIVVLQLAGKVASELPPGAPAGDDPVA